MCNILSMIKFDKLATIYVLGVYIKLFKHRYEQFNQKFVCRHVEYRCLFI